MKKVPFSRHEAVLLLDAYLNSVATGQPRARAAKNVSEDLRKMAVNNGIEFDKSYRSEKGILRQMASMESAYVGKTLIRPATPLFKETVAMFLQNRSEYDRILKEARSMVSGKKKNKELFADWLAQNVPSTRLSEIYLCYAEIEAYCLKTKILNKPLFETTDLDTVKRVQKAVAENRFFKFSHKKQMKNIVAAAQYYTTFVKTLDSKEVKVDVSTDFQSSQDVSFGRKSNEDYAEKAASSNENIEEKEILLIDFHQRAQRLAYTKPISITYFGEEHTDIENWTQLYVEALAFLSEDYPHQFLKMMNSNISGGSRIDLGTKQVSGFMVEPKKVCDNFYVETNLNTESIVSKIRILLDKCNVDYENLEIRYEKKSSAQRRESAQVGDTLSTETATKNSVSIATERADPAIEFLKEKKLEYFDLRDKGGCLWIVGGVEIKNLLYPLINANVALYFRANGGYATNGRSAWWTKAKTSHIRLTESAGGHTAAPIKTTVYPSIDVGPFETVLEQCFVKGFRLGSTLDMKKFKRYYEELNGKPVNLENNAIERIVRSCGIVYEDKVFLSKTMLSNDMKAKLLTYIEDSFNSGKKSIYFEALFREFSEDFLDSYIYNADMLRSYLAFECGDIYVIDRNQIFKEAGVSTDPVEEVRACLKSQERPIGKDDLCAILAHLPQNKVNSILCSNLEFVRNGKGEYFHADMLALSEEELENIAELIEDAIRSHGYISGHELMNAIRVRYPRTYEDYSGYSDIGWRDALKYKLGDRFSFRGNIISSIVATLTASDAFGQLAAKSDVITVDELAAFADDMGTGIYFDAVYRAKLRIDEDTFVSKKRAEFQVKETDKVLDRLCQGNYLSLADIHDFAIFPDAGFPWTIYLMESYAAFYSERYTLLHGGYNRSCAVGAIVKKSANYGGFDDLIVDVIADSGIPLNKNDALEFLVNSGYIARRFCTNIEELLIRANAQRNSKGRP